MSDQNTETDIASLSFEQALQRLETIVDKLERGDVPLQDSITLYGEGEALKKRCGELLTAAEDKVEKIRIGADGTAKGTEPLDP